MVRSGWLLVLVACAAGVALGAAPRPPAGPVVRGALELVPADDPFPIRRVRAPVPAPPDLLKELEPGPVVRLPRAEFESRVRAAGRAVAQARHAPRVVEAAYTAELDGTDLTGTAELGVLNPAGVPAVLLLDPLKLAVRDATWRGAGGAVLTTQSGPAGAAVPAVWVPGPGPQALQFRWSLAGTAEPGERRFELKVPPCAAATLQLDLPDNQVPTPLTEALLTGPLDAPGRTGRKRWQFRFGGRPRLEFAVRTTGAPSAGASAALVARYALGPNELTAAFEYELRPARGSVGEWSFLADPGLRVTDVVANNRAGWRVDPAPAPGAPRKVTVALRQPGPGGKVLVTAAAPLPDPARPAGAPLPAVRPVGAVIESEAVELRLAPGLKIESWAPGDYHLTDAATATDLTRVLSLTGALLTPGADEPFRRMPSVRVANPEAECATFERLEWAPGPASSVLVARVAVRATRGPVFQLVVRPPPGYALDRGAAGTDDLVSHIGPPGSSGQAVELARPLLTGQQAELRLEFRGPGARPGEPVPFPGLGVVGAATRDGWLSISADPTWALELRPGAGAAPAGLWGWLATDAPADARGVYLFRAQEPDGAAVPAPSAPRLRADAAVSLDDAGGRWLAVTRFDLAAPGAALPGVVVFVPGPHDGARTWRLADPGNAVTGASPIPLTDVPLGGPLDLGARLVGARARAGAGTFWAVRFARPTAGTVLETAAPGPPLRTTAFALPVPRAVGAEQVTRAEPAHALGRRIAVEVAGDEVRVRPPEAAAPHLSGAYLFTAVRSPEEVVAAFGATAHYPAGGVIPVELPAGAEVRGVCVGGRWLDPAVCAARDAAGALPVPVPAGAATPFEVRYRLPVAAGWPTRRVVSPAPAAPGDPPVARWWGFADGALPGWPARPWDATADAPPLLGGPLTSGPPALVTRSDDEWVRVGAVRTADAVAAALAALLIAVGLAARRGAGAVFVLGAVAALALGAAELGPPWWARAAWPVLAAAVVALARALVGTPRPRAIAGAAAAGALALGSLELVAQPPAPATVLIGPSADGGEEVRAPAALLERLDALARPAPPAPAVASAHYEVRADDAGARVTARFVVQAFRPGDNALTLQLGDVRLERAAVDGAPAFPTAPRPDACTVPLGGPGRYEVELRFAATVTAAGGEREVRFGAPEVPDARLTAALPGAARLPQSVGRLGRQTVTAAGDRVAVEAELGAVKQVQLRWREGTGGAATVKVREACVWDVTDGGAELTGAYLVRVEQGTVPGLRFDVPAELEVLRVAVRAPDALGTAPALRDWQLGAEKGGLRALRLDFQGPAGGRFLVVLECAPRRPITRQPVLRFPRLALGSVKGETDAVYALRATRVAVDEVGRAGAIDFAADALREFVPVADLKLDPNRLPRAFRPAPGASAELRPVLRAADPPAVRTATTWTVSPGRADGAGTLAWTAAAPVALVEFAVPGARVREVRGPDVSGWTQSGGRVQVWLRAGARAGAIEWLATLAPGGAREFEVPAPVAPGARAAAAEVRVRPVEGWSARADRARGWQPAPAAPGELRFRADGAPAPGPRVHLASTR